MATRDELMQATGARETGMDLQQFLSEMANRLSGQANAGGAAEQLARQLEQLKSVSQGQADAVSDNTQALVQNTVAQASSGESGVQKAGNVLSKIFGSGMGLSPVISGIIGLFRGGDDSEPAAPLTTYSRPAAIDFEGVFSRSEGTGIVPRGQEQPAQTATQITIQVQAMDSRSFLDHRDEIARAVREAMLNSHSLNDVVNEL